MTLPTCLSIPGRVAPQQHFRGQGVGNEKNSLETRTEKMQERFNKDLEEIKKWQEYLGSLDLCR